MKERGAGNTSLYFFLSGGFFQEREGIGGKGRVKGSIPTKRMMEFSIKENIFPTQFTRTGEYTIAM